MLNQNKLNKTLDFLSQYKQALLEKVMEKMSEIGGDDPHYSLGNFAMEDFMDNHTMRLSHLNALIMEIQVQLEEQNVRYEKLSTEVHEISKDDLKYKLNYYLERIPPIDLKWVKLEKIPPDKYFLILTKREDV